MSIWHASVSSQNRQSFNSGQAVNVHSNRNYKHYRYSCILVSDAIK